VYIGVAKPPPQRTAVRTMRPKYPASGLKLTEALSRSIIGKRSGSRYRAERVVIIHEMAIEEARNTEVNITRTERGRYGNAHTRYDINDGLVDVILEVIPTEEQIAERARDQKEQKGKRDMAKEAEHEIKENI
jgi:VIT1/CCC1 family predicted Fe2+/Mn2+ transporter